MKNCHVKKGKWNVNVENIFEAEAIALLEMIIENKKEALDRDSVLELAEALEFNTFVRLVQEDEKWWNKYIELVEDWFED